MKTLADFKRAMTVGTVWMRKHVNEIDFVKREVSRVKTTGVWIKDEYGKEVFLDYPKATDFEINASGEAEIYLPAIFSTYDGSEQAPRRLVLTYRKA